MARDTYGKLTLLKRGGSTSRVLDLLSVWEKHGDTAAVAQAPFFQIRRLNHSFVVKHTLRAWEREQLGGKRISATKLIIPISEDDLEMGGHSIFVEDPTLASKLSAHLGVAPNSPKFVADLERLRGLAALPSFDPYLLYEHFRRLGVEIADVYFNISDHELGAISDYVAGQIELLVQRASKVGQKASLDKSRRLATALFEDQDSEQLMVIRQALGMTDAEYREGVFGWKGTLYYSWRAGRCYDDILACMKALKSMDLGAMSSADRAAVRKLIGSIAQQANKRWMRLQDQLSGYRAEFTRFVERGDPGALKAFLMRAPSLFVDMGEDISCLQHVSSYWAFWTEGRDMSRLTGEEAFDLLPDFEAALTATEPLEIT